MDPKPPCWLRHCKRCGKDREMHDDVLRCRHHPHIKNRLPAFDVDECDEEHCKDLNAVAGLANLATFTQYPKHHSIGASRSGTNQQIRRSASPNKSPARSTSNPRSRTPPPPSGSRQSLAPPSFAPRPASSRPTSPRLSMPRTQYGVQQTARTTYGGASSSSSAPARPAMTQQLPQANTSINPPNSLILINNSSTNTQRRTLPALGPAQPLPTSQLSAFASNRPSGSRVNQNATMPGLMLPPMAPNAPAPPPQQLPWVGARAPIPTASPLPTTKKTPDWTPAEEARLLTLYDEFEQGFEEDDWEAVAREMGRSAKACKRKFNERVEHRLAEVRRHPYYQPPDQGPSAFEKPPRRRDGNGGGGSGPVPGGYHDRYGYKHVPPG